MAWHNKCIAKSVADETNFSSDNSNQQHIQGDITLLNYYFFIFHFVFMRTVLALFATIVTLHVNAQESSKFSVILKGQHRDSIPLPKVLDTVFLNLTFEQTTKIYTNISTPDSAFILSDVPIGNTGLCFRHNILRVTLPILVCTSEPILLPRFSQRAGTALYL